MARRFDKDWKPWTAANAEHNVRLHPGRLPTPLRWKKPRKIFVCSTSDLFHEEVPIYFVHDVFATIGAAPRHIFIILTKRPQRMMHDLTSKYFPDGYIKDYFEGGKISWPLSNLWILVTVENQRAADERIPYLFRTPAAVRGVSIEPMLGPIDISKYLWPTCWHWDSHYNSPQEATAAGAYAERKPQKLVAANRTFLNWVIVGGESGPKARSMHPAWPRSIRDQCQKANVPFFFKQWGEWAPSGSRGEYCCNPGASIHDLETMNRIGKKAAGRELDGRIWEEFP